MDEEKPGRGRGRPKGAKDSGPRSRRRTREDVLADAVISQYAAPPPPELPLKAKPGTPGGKIKRPEDYDHIPADKMTEWQLKRASGYIPSKTRRNLEAAGYVVPIVEALEVNRVRDVSRAYTSRALAVLVSIAENGRNEAARVSACKELLDRGWGKVAVEEHKASQAEKTRIEINFPDPPKIYEDDQPAGDKMRGVVIETSADDVEPDDD